MIDKRYFLMILNSLKMIFAGISSICVASLFNLDFAVSAGIVAMLSIMPSKKETFHTAFSRFAGFLTALFISFLCFKMFGINLTAYFIYLGFYIFICQYFKWFSSIVMNSVLISHFLTFGKMDISTVLNEIFIFLIGVTFGILVNLHLHKKQFQIDKLKTLLDDEIKNVLNRMAQRITDDKLQNYDGSCFENIHEILFEAKSLAFENSKNQFKPEFFDLNYINMRENQIQILYEMYKRVKNIHTPPFTAKMISDFLKKTAREYHIQNDCSSLLHELDIIKMQMKEKPLPQTREEFESRAELYTLLQLITEFLNLKKSFILPLKKSF